MAVAVLTSNSQSFGPLFSQFRFVHTPKWPDPSPLCKKIRFIGLLALVLKIWNEISTFERAPGEESGLYFHVGLEFKKDKNVSYLNGFQYFLFPVSTQNQTIQYLFFSPSVYFSNWNSTPLYLPFKSTLRSFPLDQLLEVYFHRMFIFVPNVMSNSRIYIYGLCSSALLQIRNHQTRRNKRHINR